MYKKSSGNVVVFLVLYIDDILLIENDVGTLTSVKVWLSAQFNMKDLGEAVTFLGSSFSRSPKNNVGLIPGILY